MRHHDNVIQLKQRVILGGWLFFEHVSCGAGNPFFFQCFIHCRFVYNGSAGYIDKYGGVFHGLEFLLTEHLIGFRSSGNVYRNNVRFFYHRVEIYDFNAQLLSFLIVGVFIIGDNPGWTKRLHQLRHITGNRSEAD